MLLIHNFKCRLSGLNTEDPSNDQTDVHQYHVCLNAPLHYNRATCWIPVEQLFSKSPWNQDLYSLPIKIQVSTLGLAEQAYDVYIFYNGNQVFPLCVWPPPLQQAANPTARPGTSAAVGQSHSTQSHPSLSPAQVLNHPASHIESLIQLTSPGPDSGIPWLFYAPGPFVSGTNAAEEVLTSPLPAQPRTFAPRVSSSLKNEVSQRSPPTGVLTVIVTSHGVRPILPNQEEGHNLATFSFCYAPAEKISRK